MKIIHRAITILLLGTSMLTHTIQESRSEKATLAGGCFWCMQPPFEHIPGVTSVVVGYAHGDGSPVTYDTYATKKYVEAVQITFDPSVISYAQLLDIFWRQFDPTDSGGQFNDRGPQYRSVIFYHSNEQKTIAQESKNKLAASGIFTKPIVTEITPFTNFYPAEAYHQQYHDKNPIRYNYYRFLSGRDTFLKKTWAQKISSAGKTTYKKPSVAQLKKQLTPLQYQVTQQDGTEPAFKNEYWNNKRAGIYVDIVSGEPLFSSHDKFDSGTGWPSFSNALVAENIIEGPKRGIFTSHREVRSKDADSHLGDLFFDGPQPTGLRYCINSAALRFVPVENLEAEGYGQYLKLFQKSS